MERAVPAFAAREGEFVGLADFCLFGADNGWPIGQEVRFRKATLAKGFAGQRRDVAGDRLRRTAAPLVHFTVASVIPGQNSSPSLIANYSSVMSPRDATRASEILDWYDRHRRSMPWRALPGERTAPYAVWLSEIMLQQTTVATVGPYFTEFLSRWPTVGDLAAADLDDVLHCWQGLGYYARARNLHKCAGVVSSQYNGHFPEEEAALLSLPGIGPYTAAAIRAIAFDKRAVVVDGNVERVMARLFRETDPLPDVKSSLRERADSLTPDERPGDYAQAVMDLGATVCIPRRPKCMICPWVDHCLGRDIAESLPARRPKPEKPTRRGVVYWIERPDGAVLIGRRPESGLLGGMMEFPSTAWREDMEIEDISDVSRHAPLAATQWSADSGLVRHGFTHFHLELRVLKGRVGAGTPAPDDMLWCSIDSFADQAFPTVMKKVAEKVLRGG